jgi:hypothetical protein
MSLQPPDSYWREAIKECKYHVDSLKGGSTNSLKFHLSELKRYLDIVLEEVPKHIEEMEESFEEQVCDEWNCDRIGELDDQVSSLEAKVNEWEDAYDSLIRIFKDEKDQESLKIVRDFDPRKEEKH